MPNPSSRRLPRSRWVVALAALVLVATTPLHGEPNPGLAPAALRAQLETLYRVWQQGPQATGWRERARAGDLTEPQALDDYLRALPLSPREIFVIEAEARQDMTPVPRFLEEQHVRWLGFHEKLAREWYGDNYVEARLAPAKPTPPPARVSRSSHVENNRNLGTYGGFAPLDYQGEVQIAVNPNNPNQVVVASNTWHSLPGPCTGEDTQAIFWSGDGGRSWTYTCAPNSAAYNLGACPGLGQINGADPALAWDANGNVFLNYLQVCHETEDLSRMALVVAKSSNGGATWTKHGVIHNGWPTNQDNDKNMYAIDTHLGSPYFGRHYACWDRAGNERFAYSPTGVSWTTATLPALPNALTHYGCDLTVGGDGTVHLVINSDNGIPPARVWYLQSVNGGANWSNPKFVQNLNLTPFQKPQAADKRGIFPFASIAVDTTGGACNGTLYITYSDWSNGESVASTDVWLQRSIDNGQTWGPRIKLNDDGLAGRTQFHPALAVDPSNGQVVMAWQDARNHANNRRVEIYATRSTDCGVSVEPNVKVVTPNHQFNNAGDTQSNENSTDNVNYNPNQHAEYMGIDAAAGIAYVAWPDTRQYYPLFTTDAQVENLGFSRLNFAATCGNGVREAPEICDGAALGGQTCSSQGYNGGTLGCSSACTGFTFGSCTGTVFSSLGAEDGSVEDYSLGAYVVSATGKGAAVRVGDVRVNTQRKGFLSFDTSAIPDGATVTSATLRLRRAVVMGTNPINSNLGTLVVDLSPAWSGNTSLQATDFTAAAGTGAGCFPSKPASDGDLSLCTFNATGRAAINKTGRTQVRLAFNTPQNGNDIDDYIGFFSGETGNPVDRPQLIVTWN